MSAPIAEEIWCRVLAVAARARPALSTRDAVGQARVLDRLMHAAWPGVENVAIDGWLARLAGGITGRANSVLPLESPSDVQAAIGEIEELYRQHGLAAMFQVSPAAQPPHLDTLLAERGYAMRSPTLVLTARGDDALRVAPASTGEVTMRDEPDERWMDCWWAVDGRWGPEARAIVRAILVSCPGIYASIEDERGVTACGRLALCGAWGGLYCMAVREDARRKGLGRNILSALLREGGRRGIERFWLQVVEENVAARQLYQWAGFRTASRYHYRVRSSHD